jgi:hypothetical protein
MSKIAKSFIQNTAEEEKQRKGRQNKNKGF